MGIEDISSVDPVVWKVTTFKGQPSALVGPRLNSDRK